MKFLSVLILFVILVSSCTFPVSIEEINTSTECENTKLVKALLTKVLNVNIYIGEEYIGSYNEFKVVNNYFVVTDDYGNTIRYNLCEMISVYLSESGTRLYLRF